MTVLPMAAVILTTGVMAAGIFATTTAEASVRVDWDDQLTPKVEKAPKTKISKAG